MDNLDLRRHYFRVAKERIDQQIAELKTRRADLSVEIIRLDRKWLEMKERKATNG